MFGNRQNIEHIDFFFIENRQADRYIEREGKWDKRQKKTEERKREREIKERKIIHPIIPNSDVDKKSFTLLYIKKPLRSINQEKRQEEMWNR